MQRFRYVVCLDLAAFKTEIAERYAHVIASLPRSMCEANFQARWMNLLGLPERELPFFKSGAIFGYDCGVDLRGHVIPPVPPLSDDDSETHDDSPGNLVNRLARAGARDMGLPFWQAEFAWQASFGNDSRGVASGVANIRSKPERAKSGFLHIVLLTALNRALCGGSLGFFAYRERFCRLYAISDDLVAVEKLHFDDATPQEPPVPLAANDLADVMEQETMTPDKFAASLPHTLPRDGPNIAPLSALVRWSVMAYNGLLDQPRHTPFTRFKPTAAARRLHDAVMDGQLNHGNDYNGDGEGDADVAALIAGFPAMRAVPRDEEEEEEAWWDSEEEEEPFEDKIVELYRASGIRLLQLDPSDMEALAEGREEDFNWAQFEQS